MKASIVVVHLRTTAGIPVIVWMQHIPHPSRVGAF